MSILYGVIAVLSIICTLFCLFVLKKKDLYFILFFALVCITNIGAFVLSISTNEQLALIGNTISYFGNVFLPPVMIATVLKMCNIKVPKFINFIALSLGLIIFFLASTQLTNLGWFYTSVSIYQHAGCTILIKEYGPLHIVHTIYITLYILLMLFISVLTIIKGTIKKYYTHRHAIFIALIFAINYLVWIIQKFIPSFDFELLPISYFVSIILFMALNWIIQDYTLLHEYGVKENMKEGKINFNVASAEQKVEYITSCKPEIKLTSREKDVLLMIFKNKKRKEIAVELFVSENTVKTHIKNIFDKFGVSSREELDNIFFK